MRTRFLLTAVAIAAIASPLAAQSSKSDARSIVGVWSGSASVPLGDSTITIPVSYTFTQSGKELAGTAMVPGQGTGTISNLVQDGAKLRFRVTVSAATAAAAGAPSKERYLDHDASVGADGAIEGMISLDNKPIAKFRIAQKNAAPK